MLIDDDHPGNVATISNVAKEGGEADFQSHDRWDIVPFVRNTGNSPIVQGNNARPIRVFGPDLPPKMIWERMFKAMIPELLARTVPLSMCVNKIEPIVMSKRSWTVAFDLNDGFQMA